MQVHFNIHVCRPRHSHACVTYAEGIAKNRKESYFYYPESESESESESPGVLSFGRSRSRSPIKRIGLRLRLTSFFIRWEIIMHLSFLCDFGNRLDIRAVHNIAVHLCVCVCLLQSLKLIFDFV